MQPTNQEPLNDVLAEIVLRFAPRDHAGLQLTRDTHLIDDAGIDSPRMIDIVLSIEDRIGCTIDDGDIQKVRTFGELVSLIGGRRETSVG